MKKRTVRVLFCLLLGGAMLIPLFTQLILHASGLKLMRAPMVADGETYIIAMNVSPTNDASAEYAVCAETVGAGANLGLKYKARPKTTDNMDYKFLWTVKKKGSGFTVYSEGAGQYLYLAPNGAAGLSKTSQILRFEEVNGGVTIYSVNSGQNYYLRFTNTGTPRWHAGTTESSNVFNLYALAELDQTGYDNTGKEPVYTIACFSDLHVDYGIQSWTTPVRKGTVKAAQIVKDMGGADVVLVGGDMTSANDRKAAWSKTIVEKVQQTLYDTLAPVSHTGKVLFVAGNHDSQAGVQAGHSIDSNDYTRFMTSACGEFTDSMYKTIDGVNSLLCYRYSFDAMEYVVVNTPYNSDIYAASEIFVEQVDWLGEQLDDIGDDKTAIVLCHYPISGVATRAPGTASVSYKLKQVLSKHPNVIYCYGHVHGDDSKYCWYSTSELVASAKAVSVGPQTVTTSSYTTVHMGSMGYYNNQFQPGGLTAQEPMIAQAMMIYFYNDHITFQMINTGDKSGDNEVYDIASYTIMRDNTAQFGLDPLPADPGSNTDRPDTDTAANGSSAVPSENPADPPSSDPGSASSDNGDGNLGIILAVVGTVVVVAAAAFCVYWFALRKKPKTK